MMSPSQPLTPAARVQAPLPLPAVARPPSPLHLAWIYGRHELLYLCWALMEVALIGPAALALMPWAYFWPLSAFVLWLLILLLLPFNLTRLLSLAAQPVARQRRLVLAAFVLTLLFTWRQLIFEPRSLFDLSWLGAALDRAISQPAQFWRNELLLFALLAVLWWRGLALARRAVAVSEAGFRLRLGGLLLAPLVLILALIPQAPAPLPFVMLFFLSALVATALSRAEEVSRHSNNATFGMDLRWLLSVFAASLFIVCAAAVAGLALAGRGLLLFWQWLAPLWNALALGGMVVVTTATYLLLFLVSPLVWLVRLLFALFTGLGVEGLPELEPLSPEMVNPAVDQLLDLGDTQSALFMWANRGAMILFVLLGLLVLAIALRRAFNRRPMAAGSLQSEPSTTMELAGTDRLAQRLLGRLNRWRRWRAAATVRQLYRAMSAEAAARGYPRGPSQTPYEYLPTLAQAWPADPRDTQLITNAYVRVRYGEIPESAAELDALRAAWRRLTKAPPPPA